MMRYAFTVLRPRPSALRALNYSPYVEAFRRNRGNNNSVPLKELLVGMGAAHRRAFTRIDCHPDYGVELVSQTDMFAAEPLGRVIRMDSMPMPERHRIYCWEIVVAAGGTLGET